MNDRPLVSVVVPARNEEADIAAALRCVLRQNYPSHRLEVIVADGGSSDRTRAVVAEELQTSDVTWMVVDHPAGTTPGNLNAGLAEASGAYLCRVDARSLLPPEYINACVDTLEERPDVAVTGGTQVAVARDGSSRARGIARALNNRYAMGGASYRSGAASGPTDTVYLGFFRTAQLRSCGGWDEVMLSNQDFELNRRMSSEGTIWFDGSLAVGYLPRDSVRGLWQQYHRFGRWKVRYWRHTGDRPLPRQQKVLAAPFVAVLGVAWMVARGRGSRSVARRATIAAALGMAGIAAIEATGADEPAGDPASHVIGSAAMVAVSAGWLSGVVREALTGSWGR